MNQAWLRIYRKVKSYVATIITILTSAGTEPAAYADTSIEETNKGLYDELASLGQFVTYPIPYEYHTVYEAKRFELQDYTQTYSYQPYPFSYDGELAVLYHVPTSTNAFADYIYFYSDSTYVSILCNLTAITHVEYTNGLQIYGITGDPNTGVVTYYQQSYDEEWLSTSIVTMSSAYYGTDSSIMSTIETVRPASGGLYYRRATDWDVMVGNFPINMYGTNCISVPQKLGDGWFWSCFDKAIFTDDDYLTTRIIQFDDPMLIGHTVRDVIFFKRLPHRVFYLTDIYRFYYDGRIERYRID
jgi:hypothetical protein